MHFVGECKWLLTAQEYDEWRDVEEVNCSTGVKIRFVLKPSSGQQRNEWRDI